LKEWGIIYSEPINPYLRVGWVESTNERSPAISAQNLKRVEDGIESVTNALAESNTRINDNVSTFIAEILNVAETQRRNNTISVTSYVGTGVNNTLRRFEPGGRPLAIFISTIGVVNGNTGRWQSFVGNTSMGIGNGTSVVSGVTWGSDFVQITTGTSTTPSHANTTDVIYNVMIIYEPFENPIFTSVRVIDELGFPMIGAYVGGLSSSVSLGAITNAEGIATGILRSSRTIEVVQDIYVDVLPTSTHGLLVSGELNTVTVPCHPRNTSVVVTNSRQIRFARNRNIDISLIGGGGRGGNIGRISEFSIAGSARSGGGGAGGLVTAINIPVIRGVEYPAVVAGGSGDTHFLGHVAPRGNNGVDIIHVTNPITISDGGTSGTPGMGNGGRDRNQGQNSSIAAVNGVIYGGGGAGGSESLVNTIPLSNSPMGSVAGGSPNGGRSGTYASWRHPSDPGGGSYYRVNGTSGGIGGGGGGVGLNMNTNIAPGQGGQGALIVCMS
jgi:hypothetical protein